MFSADKMAKSFGECDMYCIGWRREDDDHVVSRLHSPAVDTHWTLCRSVTVKLLCLAETQSQVMGSSVVSLTSVERNLLYLKALFVLLCFHKGHKMCLSRPVFGYPHIGTKHTQSFSRHFIVAAFNFVLSVFLDFICVYECNLLLLVKITEVYKCINTIQYKSLGYLLVLQKHSVDSFMLSQFTCHST